MTVPAYKHENKTLQNEFARTYGEIDKRMPFAHLFAPTVSARFPGQNYVYNNGFGMFRIYTSITAGNGSGDWVLTYSSDYPFLTEGKYRQIFTATANQTLFELGFSYTTGSNNLLVFAGGLLLPVSNVAETDDTSITLSAPVPYGANVRVITTLGGTYNRVFSQLGPATFNYSQNPAGTPDQNRADIVATAGQTLFPLGFSYTTGRNELLVFVGGLIIPTAYVAETSTSSITLPVGIPAGTIVSVVSLDHATQDREEFTAVEGQTDFSLSFTFEPGNNELLVFIGGSLTPPEFILETSTSTFSLSTGVPAGTIIRVVRM